MKLCIAGDNVELFFNEPGDTDNVILAEEICTGVTLTPGHIKRKPAGYVRYTSRNLQGHIACMPLDSSTTNAAPSVLLVTPSLGCTEGEEVYQHNKVCWLSTAAAEAASH